MHPNSALYGFLFILIRWVLILLTIVFLSLGGYIYSMPPHVPARSFLLDLYISLGLTCVLLISIRIFLRFIFKLPPYPDLFPPWQKRLASNLCQLIYFFIILMSVCGYLEAEFTVRPISFWGIPMPVWGVMDERLADLFWRVQGIAAWVLTGLIVVLAAIVALNKFKQSGVTARIQLDGQQNLPQLVPAETAAPVAPKSIQGLVKNFRAFGWICFWLQFALAFIAGLLLTFATSGRAFSPAATGPGDSMYWASYGFFLLCFAVLLAFYYTRVAGKVQSSPDSYLNAENNSAFWFLGVGIFASLLGIFISFSGVALSLSLLISKTISQPPGIAITDPTKIIRALDIFILMVNFNLLVAHFIGASISLWLSVRVSKARLEYR